MCYNEIMIPKIDVQIYRTKTGKVVFSDWLKRLDKNIKAIIDTRIARIRGGNFGDCKRLTGADGLFELKIDYGPGFRIYYGRRGEELIILLSGGDKQSQDRDISKAREYWQDYLSRIERGGKDA